MRHVTRLAALGLVAHVGPYGAGQLAESSPNPMLVGITIGAVPEALPLCETGGADPAKVREAISGGFADSRVLQVRGQWRVEHDFAPRGRMHVPLKDPRNARHRREIGPQAPITAPFDALHAAAIANGPTDLDHSGRFVELAPCNGLG